MSVSLGMACCFYNERDSITGLIENSQGFFDDLVFADCGPNGKPSDDGSLDILRSWGITPLQWNINEGFGVIRTNLIRQSKTDWVWISDCDERFYPILEVLQCEGTEKYPDTHTPNLTVTSTGQTYNQGAVLRGMLEAGDGHDALVGVRRHWHDFSMRKPCQNWYHIRDFQCRCIRNVESVGFDPNVKLHERIIDFRTGREPNMIRVERPDRGIMWEHFHCKFKPMSAKKNAEDMATYRMLDEKSTHGMWLESAKGVAA